MPEPRLTYGSGVYQAIALAHRIAKALRRVAAKGGDFATCEHGNGEHRLLCSVDPELPEAFQVAALTGRLIIEVMAGCRGFKASPRWAAALARMMNPTTKET
jgi:hypothetical protein